MRYYRYVLEASRECTLFNFHYFVHLAYDNKKRMSGLRDLKSIWQTLQLSSVIVWCCISEIAAKNLTTLPLFDFWFDITSLGITTSCYLKYFTSRGLTCSKPRDSTWLGVIFRGLPWLEGATSKLYILKDLSLNLLNSSFIIRVNLLHP